MQIFRKRWMVAAILLLTPMTAVATRDAAWRPLTGLIWSNSTGTVTAASFDLADDIAMSWLPTAAVRGHWVRVTGSAPASAADFKVWIQAFARNGMTPMSRPLPITRCKIFGERKFCSNQAWIGLDAPRVRAAFYSEGVSVRVIPWRVEVDEKVSVEPSSLRRYDALLRELRDLYFRSRNVDWAETRAAGLPVLAAPVGIDPVPQAAQFVLAMLPDHRHMSIIRNNAPFAGDTVQMPRCEALNKNQWKLILPATTGNRVDDRHYVDISQKCLREGQNRRWVIDLTADMGGNASVQLAALAPLLGTGLQLKYLDGVGEVTPVELTRLSVRVGGHEVLRWSVAAAVMHAPASVQFVIGSGCGSACEAVVLAVKGRFVLLGQPTAGLTSANDLIRLNQDLSLVVTAGLMTDRTGKSPYPQGVQPDVVLDTNAVRRLLHSNP